jgi:hypothetical protein
MQSQRQRRLQRHNAARLTPAQQTEIEMKRCRELLAGISDILDDFNGAPANWSTVAELTDLRNALLDPVARLNPEWNDDESLAREQTLSYIDDAD